MSDTNKEAVGRFISKLDCFAFDPEDRDDYDEGDALLEENKQLLRALLAARERDEAVIEAAEAWQSARAAFNEDDGDTKERFKAMADAEANLSAALAARKDK